MSAITRRVEDDYTNHSRRQTQSASTNKLLDQSLPYKAPFVQPATHIRAFVGFFSHNIIYNYQHDALFLRSINNNAIILSRTMHSIA